MSEDHIHQPRMRDTLLDSEAVEIREAAARESSRIQHRGNLIRRFLWKNKNGVTKKVVHFSRNLGPILSNADREGAPNIEAQDIPLGVEQLEGADPQLALLGARETIEHRNIFSGPARTATTAVQSAHADAPDFLATNLQTLRTFDSVVRTLADLNPYTKVALGVLTSASKIILAQGDRDEAVLGLYNKLDQVYKFMTQDETLGQISSMRIIVGRISEQTLECAHFIRDYSETKNFWRRLGKNVISETDNMIQRYSDVLDTLMQTFRDQVSRNVAIYVHCTDEILDLSDMAYATGAGQDFRKQCLPGTRTEILSQIIGWINDSADDIQRVLWLSGPAGTGKSAIAHTIASSFIGVGGLGSFFCFDRHRDADRLYEKIFCTIARDIADCDLGMRRALVDAVNNASALKNTRDIIQQWQKLLMEPLEKLSDHNVVPVVIMIDALDESGGVETRRDLLRILAGKLRNPDISPITALPPNVRLIVISRPLRDIDAEFDGVPHIRRISMDDIPPEVTRRDIHAYVSVELEGLSDFGDREFAALAELADGLFEWARLACESIKSPSSALSPRNSFNTVVSREPAKRTHLLSDMYRFILADIMRADTFTHAEFQQMQLARFHSVMGQILGAAEPLPINSMNAMRRHYPDESCHYGVEFVVKCMGSLLSGTTNPSTPIRLHSSFREFLTDPECSGEFFVDVSKAQRDLAFASLRVMEHGLRFNICTLKSSYLPNREDSELQERVERNIPPHLSYSCRFWALHLPATGFDAELAEEATKFLYHERLLFWLEVISLIKAVSDAVSALSLISQWLKSHSRYEDVSSTAMDMQRFIETFDSIILHSTPHLYVSALPFLPANSAITTKFTARFPNTFRLVSGHDSDSAAVQSVLSGHGLGVLSVSFSPDRTCIVTGSADKTVQLWDVATGQSLCEPLRGHTGAVNSISFSPNGTRIVSGSHDKTLRMWNAVTMQPLGEPLRGHTAWVNSVSFSLDGTHIVSGSSDNTVRLWDAVMRQPLDGPLRGHTAWVNSVSFSPNGTLIASGSDDKTVRLWDVATRRPFGEPLRGHTGVVSSVSFSLDGTRILSGSYDNTIRLWETASRKLVGEPLRGHTTWVNSVSFSPDGTRIVSGSSDKTVLLWDGATGQPVGEPLRGHTGGVRSVAFSPDGTRIVSASVDGTIRLWYATSRLPSSTSSLDRNHFICFSSNPNHSLCNPAELIKSVSRRDGMSTPFSLGSDGWMLGPDCQLLFWVPPAFRHAFYTPWTALVMPRGHVELDLSRMAHGQHWENCRDGPCN